MKNLKLIALVVAICISTVSFALPSKENPNTKLREQIIELLGTTSDLEINSKISTEVIFTVNNENEIIIISVKSKNQNVKSYVKSKLNYKKVDFDKLNKEKIYRMPLTIVSK